MAVVTKNLNQYRKVYPGIRRTPRYDTRITLDQDLTIEVGSVTLADEESGTYIFSETYTDVPSVTASLVGGVSANVNLYISSLTTGAVTIGCSAVNSGTIKLIIISQSS